MGNKTELLDQLQAVKPEIRAAQEMWHPKRHPKFPGVS